MSSTRKAAEDSDLSQERWCSAPEFNHSLNAIAVAKRAQLVSDPTLKALIWFIQWRSLLPNGLDQFAKDFLALFSGRLGTPTMRRLGCEKGRIYSAAQVRAIRKEIPRHLTGDFILAGEGEIEEWGSLRDFLPEDDSSPQAKHAVRQYPESYPASKFVELIAAASGELVDHLKRICLDPAASFTAPARICTLPWREQERGQACTAAVWWFDDLVSALLDYRERSIQEAKKTIASTAVGGKIFETLDFCFRQRRMVLIEGNPGLGKSVTTKTWCDMQAGLARWFEVPASNDDRSFYSKIAAALGVGSGPSFTGQQIKTRVEAALSASGLMLVCDEASRLWPQYHRPKGQPGRMLWIMSKREEGIPIAMSGFLFSKWRQLYSEKTNWPDDQLERRLNRSVMLPPVHSESDLLEIAKAILPTGDRASILALVAIARINPKKGASAMIEAIATARDFCEQEGASAISYALLKRAIQTNHPEMAGACEATAENDTTELAVAPENTDRKRSRSASIHTRCSDPASLLQASPSRHSLPPASAAVEHFSEEVGTLSGSSADAD